MKFRNSYFVIGRDVTLFSSDFLGIYEEKELDILLELEFPDDLIFWDVGANVGIYSVLFGKEFPAGKVISFEPNSSLHASLTENLSLNGVRNARIENFGLSNIKSFGQIETSRFRAGAGKICLGKNDNVDSKSIPVNTRGMYAREFPDTIPNFIKIDVEGHEPEVIEGLFTILLQFKPV